MAAGPDDGAWQHRRILVFNGQYDTKIKTGEDYATCELAELFALQPVDKPKANAPAFIPSSYHDYDGREHKAQREQGSFVALAGDVDRGNHGLALVETLVRQFAGGAAWLIYSSAHARPGDMRWRIILPLDQPLAFAEWHDAQNAFFDFMEANGVEMDRALGRAAQPIYLPNVPPIHHQTGEPLRGGDNRPLHFATASSGIKPAGLRIDASPLRELLADLRTRRVEDERRREQLRVQAERRRATRNSAVDESLIDGFNQAVTIAALLARYDYRQSPRKDDDWRSPHQTSRTFATRIMDAKWVSLSASDAAAGLGARCQSGCYGDAYDLFVHYEHGGDHKAAFRQLRAERKAAAPLESGSAGQSAEGRSDDCVDPHTAQVQEDGPADPGSGKPPGKTAAPIDLWARYIAPELPTGLLPPLIENFARRHGEVMGADPAGLAMAALTVCGASISDDIAVQVKLHDPSWRESARLWVGMVGLPSKKKTPIFNAAMRPLRRIDDHLMAAYMIARAAYDALAPKEQKLAARPKQRRLIVSDATPEALQEVLKDSPGGILSEQDELSGWFGAMDKYAPGKGSQADRAFWLKAYNGGRYNLNRITRGATQIPNLSIALLGGIQPEPIRKIATESVDDGLVQRLIPVILRPATVGMDVPTDGAFEAYERLVDELTRMQPPARSGIPSLSEAGPPQALRFSDGARIIREGLEREHLALTEALERTSPKLAAHFGKYDGLFARLCVIWHCIEHAGAVHPPVDIHEDTAGRVAAFMGRFIRPSAIAFYAGLLGLSDGHETLMDLGAYIVSEQLTEVDARTVQRSTRSLRSFTADEARRLCEKLEAFGWLEPIEPKVRSNTPRWRVEPAVHDLFADRGRREAERRRTAREALRNALGG